VIESPEDPYRVEDVLDIFETYGVSAHYLIDRKGTILRLVSEDRIAYHGGKGKHTLHPDRPNQINNYSIGIELLAIGSEEDMKGFLTHEQHGEIEISLLGYTEKQYASLRRLIEYLVVRYSGIEADRRHIIGHDEYAPDRKNDPGELFDWDELELSVVK
jgi:N-acetyl-anhydromuramyl-L-alanine amidase AmpD